MQGGLAHAGMHCHSDSGTVGVRQLSEHTLLADDVDEEDRRPTQRRRLEEAQAGGFDENMEPLVSNLTSRHHAGTPDSFSPSVDSTLAPCRVHCRRLTLFPDRS